jgi:hypothetical protein
MKEGDIVFCIDSSDHGKKQKLTYGKGYTIKRIDNYKLNSSISIKNDSGVIGIYNFNRFITLKEWRDKKLKELGL